MVTKTKGPAVQALPPGLLPAVDATIVAVLLTDRTTNSHIKWVTDDYAAQHGTEYAADKEILPEMVQGVIFPRWTKNTVNQKDRTRKNAEVFTPSWIVDKQVSAVMEDFDKLSLSELLSKTWLEITCGEAPYMVTQYEMATGEILPLEERVGFIDLKFQRLNKEVGAAHDLWWEHAQAIYKASYGYEMQGDSLFIARVNLLLTFVDNYRHVFGTVPSQEMMHRIADIISYNVFQVKCIINKNKPMTYEIPFSNGTVPRVMDWKEKVFTDFGQ